MADGWIKLYRKLSTSPAWASGTNEQKLFMIALLLEAAHTPHYIMVGQERVLLKPGQVYASLQGLSNLQGVLLTRQSTRTALKNLENLNFLTREVTSRGQLITIVKWGFYQYSEDEANTDTNTPLTHLVEKPNHVSNTNNKNGIRMYKNDKNNIKGVHTPATFSPPTIQDAKEYIEKKGFSVDPEAFVSYYESQHWRKANGQPLTDWQAAIRYWERRDRERKEELRKKEEAERGRSNRTNHQGREYDDEFLESLYKKLD